MFYCFGSVEEFLLYFYTVSMLIRKDFVTCRKKVLTISSNINEVGSLNKELTLCLLVLWIVVYFCIWRGIKWSAKVRHVN